MILAESEINQTDLCLFALNGELDKLKFICELLDENGKNEIYNLDIAGYYPYNRWDDSKNYPIRLACAHGHIKIVKYLMENYSHLVDITSWNNYAILSACEFGYIEIVKYLMENWSHLVDITANNNEAIICACENGHLLVVEYLMKNWSHLVDITANNNEAIRLSCYNGHILVVKYLMVNWSHLVDITANNNEAIIHACKNGNIEVVKYLIENWSHLIDITAKNNEAIRLACKNHKIDVVKYLMDVCIEKILDNGLDNDEYLRINNLLLKNDGIYEYNLLANKLNERKIKLKIYEKIEGRIEIFKYLIAVCIKKKLERKFSISLTKIINSLIKNDAIYEYKILKNGLNEEKIDNEINKKIEKLIENKRNLCAQIECHPKLIGGQMGIKCEEGLNEVKLLQ